jgi:hypothetical protein
MLTWEESLSFHSLGNSSLECSVESCVIGVDVGLSCSLGVDEDALGLSASEDGHLETTSDTWVLEELVLELTSTEVSLNFVDEVGAVTAIASAATVLDVHDVGCILIALNFVRLLRSLH